MTIIDTNRPNGITTNADSASFTILPNVVVSVDAGLHSDTFPFQVVNDNVVLFNRGSLLGDQSTGITTTQNASRGMFINDAGGSVAGYIGVGLLGSFETLKNIGSVVGFQNMAVICNGVGALIDNHGYMFGVTAGVVFTPGAKGGRLVNSGVIQSLDSGLSVESGNAPEITNAGTIEGGIHAVHFGDNAGAMSLVNSGDLIGGVRSDALGGDDTVRNAGEIVGQVLLGPGDDVFNGAGGTSGAVFGEAGADRIRGGTADDTLSGGGGADILKGRRGDDALDGGSGADVLKGGKGDDWLQGGTGRNLLKGGAGTDQFVFQSLEPKTKTKVKDFKLGTDSVVLDDAVFVALSAGPLSDKAFDVGKHADSSATRILYDQDSGKLYYDADGAKDGAHPIQFAKLHGAADIDADSFLVI